MATRTREGVWRCKQCGEEGIPGLQSDCPNPECKEPRNVEIDPEEAVTLTEDARILTDPAELAQANSGPEWYCNSSTCGQNNPGNVDTCEECGQPRGANDFVVERVTYVKGVAAQDLVLSTPEQVDEDRLVALELTSDPLQVLAEGPASTHEHTLDAKHLPTSAPPEGGWLTTLEGSTESIKSDSVPTYVSDLMTRLGEHRRVLLGGLAVLVLLTLIIPTARFVYVNYVKATPINLTVQTLTWQRQLEVEVFKTFYLEGWDPPYDARVTNSYRKVKEYKPVIDHYEERTETRYRPETTGTREEEYVCGTKTVDNKNGTFSEEDIKCKRTVDVVEQVPYEHKWDEPVYVDEPIYATWYHYEVDEWVTDFYEPTGGITKEPPPYWGNPPLREDQRIGRDHRSTYLVILTDEQGREHDREVNEYTWASLEVGKVVIGHQTKQGTVRRVEWVPESS